MSTLRDKGASPYYRNKAVVALGNSGDGSTVPILLAELEKARDPIVKQNTIAALGRLRDKQAVPALLKILDAPVTGNVSGEGEWEAIFRRQAANALGYIGDSSALASLKKAMDATHEYQSVRDAAKSAIRKIEKPE
jgi:HEAT repeat protein